MLRQMTQWLRGETGGDRRSVRGYVPLNGAPAYPPPDEGIPAVGVEDLIESERDRIARVAHNTKLTPDNFELLMTPVLRRFISYVHLLPASQGHHHRGQGGLLAHSLEVAFFSSQAASAKIFGFGETSLRKKREIPRWHVAATLVGLLHDIGKPISDMEIKSEEGLVWNPFAMSLSDWLAAERIDRYYLKWRDDRYLRHKKIASTILPEIITPELKAWMSVDDVTILQSVLEAIGDTGEEKVLTEMMARADEASVARDMRMQPAPPAEGEANAPPLADLIVDAMQSLWAQGDWTANTPGGRVWSGDKGTFIVWKRAAEEVAHSLGQQGVSKFPRDAEAMAEVLVSAGVAVPGVDASKNASPFWLISTDYFDNSRRPTYLYSIKLVDPESILGELPTPVTITLKGEEDRAAEKPSESTKPTEPPTTEAMEKRGIATGEREDAQAEGEPVPEQSDDPDPAKAKSLGLPDPNELDAPPEIDAGATLEEVELPPSLQTAIKPRRAPSAGNEEINTTADTKGDLTEAGRIGEVLAMLAKRVRDGEMEWGDSFAAIDGEHYLRFPGCLAEYGRPREIADEAADAGWIVPRSDKPKASPAHEIGDGERGLMLNEELRKRLEGALEDPVSETTTETEETLGSTKGGSPETDPTESEEATTVAVDDRARAIEVAEAVRQALIQKDPRFYNVIQVEEWGNTRIFRKIVMGLLCNNLGFSQAELLRAIETAPFMQFIDGGKIQVRLSDE